MTAVVRWAAVGLLSALCVQAAQAASVSVGGGALAAGTNVVAACDSDGVTYRHVVDASGSITSVSVSGIAAACAGGTLRITLANAGTAVGSGSAALPSSGFDGTASIALSPQPASTTVTAVFGVVEGP